MFNMQMIGQIMNDVRTLQQNPGQIGQYLANHNRISPEQLAQIQQMNNPQQIGMYLMQNGMIPQNQAAQVSQFFQGMGIKS